MSLLEFVATYFTSFETLSTLAILYVPLVALLILFRLKREDPELRSRMLVSIFMISAFDWAFLASSVLFCQVLLGLYYTARLTAVKTVLGLALVTSLAGALPFSIFVTHRVPQLLLRRLAWRLSETSNSVERIFRTNMARLGLANARVAQSLSSEPFAYTVGGRANLVVVSKGLIELLDSDEMETVLAHELAHVKDGDTWLKVLVAVYRRILFFDPLLRLVEVALHREKEFLADSLSARVTRKPLSLASALLKINSASSNRLPAYIASLSINRQTGLLRRAPSVKERIVRLLRIADELRESR